MEVKNIWMVREAIQYRMRDDCPCSKICDEEAGRGGGLKEGERVQRRERWRYTHEVVHFGIGCLEVAQAQDCSVHWSGSTK
jgi:hypothetical protein